MRNPQGRVLANLHWGSKIRKPGIIEAAKINWKKTIQNRGGTGRLRSSMTEKD